MEKMREMEQALSPRSDKSIFTFLGEIQERGWHTVRGYGLMTMIAVERFGLARVQSTGIPNVYQARLTSYGRYAKEHIRTQNPAMSNTTMTVEQLEVIANSPGVPEETEK